MDPAAPAPTPTHDAIAAVDKFDLEAFARAVRDGADLNSVYRTRSNDEMPSVAVCITSLAVAASIDPRPEWADHLAMSLIPDFAKSVVMQSLVGLRVDSRSARLIVSALLATGIASDDNLAATGVHAAKGREIDVDYLTPAGVAAALIELRDINTMYVATFPRLTGGDLRCLKSVATYGSAMVCANAHASIREWLADLASQLGAPADMAALASFSLRVERLNAWRDADGADTTAEVAEVVGATLCDPRAREHAQRATSKKIMWAPDLAAVGVAAWYAGYLESREAAPGALRFCD